MHTVWQNGLPIELFGQLPIDTILLYNLLSNSICFVNVKQPIGIKCRYINCKEIWISRLYFYFLLNWSALHDKPVLNSDIFLQKT